MTDDEKRMQGLLRAAWDRGFATRLNAPSTPSATSTEAADLLARLASPAYSEDEKRTMLDRLRVLGRTAPPGEQEIIQREIDAAGHPKPEPVQGS